MLFDLLVDSVRLNESLNLHLKNMIFNVNLQMKQFDMMPAVCQLSYY